MFGITSSDGTIVIFEINNNQINVIQSIKLN